jgi:hypothetical protein
MHRHDRARCIVGIAGGTLKKTEEDGTKSDLTFETGRSYWLEAGGLCKLRRLIAFKSSVVSVLMCTE